MEFRSLRRRRRKSRGSQNYPGVRLWPSRWFIFPPAYREKADRRSRLLATADMDYVVTPWSCAILFMKKIPQTAHRGDHVLLHPSSLVDPSTRRENGPTAWLWNFFNYITRDDVLVAKILASSAVLPLVSPKWLWEDAYGCLKILTGIGRVCASWTNVGKLIEISSILAMDFNFNHWNRAIFSRDATKICRHFEHKNWSKELRKMNESH